MSSAGGFGPDVIQRILPHRQPFLMVDRVDAFTVEPASLHACRHITGNESVFAGHFPGLSLWPGVYTIEGLAQACQLLSILVDVDAELERLTGAPDQARAEFANLERGQQLREGYDREAADRLLAGLGSATTRIGFSSIVSVKLLQPVFAGCRLDYHVRMTHRAGLVRRFEVEAFVGRQEVARGELGVSGNARSP